MTTVQQGTVCRHERAHVTDSQFHGDGYATAESRRIFCDVCRLQRWLDVEAALALSQAEVGLIPQWAAEEIARCADVTQLSLDDVAGGIRHTRHSLVPLLRALERACAHGAGEFVHHGATTQDIQDTAQSLEIRDVLNLVQRDMHTLLAQLRDLATSHRDTLMMGRTHAQPALPTTFGLKAAGWLTELLHHSERLAALKPRVVVAELFGGVGTMAGFEGRGPQLLERFAARLDVGTPTLGWHVARDGVAEYATTLAMVSATLARIADEIRLLARPELAELEEGWTHGQVGSSTMPHKRNPEACEQIVVLARLARASAMLGLEAMVQEHERDSRGLRLEWVVVADVAHYTLCALANTEKILSGLIVHAERMAEHAHEAADTICTEALMLALARRVGKQTAYARVYEASQTAQAQAKPLRAYISERTDLLAPLTCDDVDRIMEPASQVGEAGGLVDQAVARLEGTLRSEKTAAPAS